ncbi:MAG: DUF4339 domain-containing protein [Planctomycetaceae bacterium]|nr:DUF4339 domain-containing protein [Planctomycetaceae bacterium]
MPENEKQWFVDMQNEVVGPVLLDMLREWLRVGTITPETWVRQDGSSEWHPLAMIDELDLTTEGTQDLDQPDGLPSPYIRFNDLEMDVPQPTDRDRLLNRAFAMKCIAIVFLLLGTLIIFCAMAISVQNRVDPPMIILFAGILYFLPVGIFYYVLGSISVSLTSSAELHGTIEELQKKLIALEKSIAKSSPQETLEQ